MSISPRHNPIRIIEHAAEDVYHWDARIERKHNRNMKGQFQSARGLRGVKVDKFGLAVSPIKLKTKKGK